jgi:DNA-directed RNA polymerase specialized sigma24 family protein
MAEHDHDRRAGRPNRRRKRGEAGDGALPSSVSGNVDAAIHHVAEHRTAGPYKEILEAYLWEYGRDVLMSWMFDGTIFERCRQRGIHVDYVDWAWWELRESRDQRMDLAVDTLSRAVRGKSEERSPEGELLEREWTGFFNYSLPLWDPNRASLRTYFVGSLLYPFATEFRKWHEEKSRRRESLSPGWTVAELVERAVSARDLRDNDPVHQVVRRDLLYRVLARTDPVNRQIADLVMRGHTYGEIAEELGLTERAVEGRLYRLRRKNKHVDPAPLEGK